ncbi:MAG: biopolymer transporter ExbD [Pseudomonadota bacterium]
MRAGRASRTQRAKGEPTLPLINIVFLMLIFFLVTSQMSRPLNPDLQLVNTDDEELVAPPDAIVLDAEGAVTFRGEVATVEDIVRRLDAASISEARILPDRRAPARAVIDLASDLRAAGAGAVFIVTEQAL